MNDYKRINKNIILEVIFYPNNDSTNKNEYKIIWKKHVSPILLLKEMDAHAKY